MQNIMLLAGRIVAGVAGGLRIYAAFFLQENEEGKLQDTLAAAWVRMSDLQQKAISRHTAFLKVVADITSKGFTKLFGERLLGPKAIGAAMCYSQAAFFLLFTILSTYLASSRLYTSREEAMAGWAEAVRLAWTLGILS